MFRGIILCCCTTNSKSGMFRPKPLVICGPSGVGKSTLLKKLFNDFGEIFGFSISHTSRKPREGEKDGREYHFVSRSTIEEMISQGEFIEHAEFSGNHYGTSKKAIEDVQSQGKICILDIEIEGVKQIKKSNLQPRCVFIGPPSLEDLETRLRNRGSETDEAIRRRLAVAKTEIEYGEAEGNFDIVIENQDVDATYAKLKNFLIPDICEVSQHLQALKGSGDASATATAPASAEQNTSNK